MHRLQRDLAAEGQGRRPAGAPSSGPRVRGMAGLGLLLAAVLAACAPAPRAPLRVGVLVFPSYELLFLAADSGLLPRESVRQTEAM